MQELISVVIPIYKVENYLDRCVQSLCQQTYANIEIILVNDGSPDRCPEICEHWASKGARIQVLHKKNGGLSDARNAGMRIAKGVWINFVDSDDWVHPQYLEHLYTLAQVHRADIVMCDHYTTSDAEQLPKLENNPQLQLMSGADALKELFGQNAYNFVVSWAKLYRRELFTGIEFPKARLHEDEATTYKLLERAKTIVYSSAKLLYYWQRPGSITKQPSMTMLLDKTQALFERGQFLLSHNFPDLAGRSLKVAFHCIFNIEPDQLTETHQLIVKRQLQDIRHLLDLSRQGFLFRCFYKLFYSNPWLARRIYRSIIKPIVLS